MFYGPNNLNILRELGQVCIAQACTHVSMLTDFTWDIIRICVPIFTNNR